MTLVLILAAVAALGAALSVRDLVRDGYRPVQARCASDRVRPMSSFPES